MSLTAEITGFVQNIVDAMGVTLTVNVDETPEGTHINLEGEDGGVFVRNGGEAPGGLRRRCARTRRRLRLQD